MALLGVSSAPKVWNVRNWALLWQAGEVVCTRGEGIARKNEGSPKVHIGHPEEYSVRYFGLGGCLSGTPVKLPKTSRIKIGE